MNNYFTTNGSHVNGDDYIQRALSGHWSEVKLKVGGISQNVSSRHDAWLSLSLQMNGEGWTHEQQYDALRTWIPDRDKPDSELWRIIKGASRKNPKPASTSGTLRYHGALPAQELPKVKPFEHSGEKRTIPSTLAGTSFSKFLSTLHAPDDHICITWPIDGDPRQDKVYTVEEWQRIEAEHPECFSHADGIWYVVNPLKDCEFKEDGKFSPRNKLNVAKFKYALLELDADKVLSAEDMKKPELVLAEKERQYAYFVESNLPIAALYDSGGKSIHAVLRIDAKDQAEFDARVARIYEYAAKAPGLDSGRKSSAQLSRLPGAFRGELKQALICWDTGSANYEEWEDSITPRIFDIEDPMDWTNDDIALPPVLIDGWLHKGHVGMLTGSMKTNKSWSLMELAICHAMELQWFGRQCHKAKVLYIDAEIRRPFWRQRMGYLCQQRGLSFEDVFSKRVIKPAFVAGNVPNISALRTELERLFNRGELSEYDLIIVDPIYQFYNDDWDENANSDMAKLGRVLRGITELTGVSLIFAHHHTKGNQDGKRDIEKASGGGAFGRFVQSGLAITLVDDAASQYTLGWTTSNFPPTPKQVAYRREFSWEITDEDPKNVGKKILTVDDIVDCLPNEGARSETWLELCRDKHEVSDKAFEALRARAKRDERVYMSPIGKTWQPTASELERRGAILTPEE
jgi:RecA-family ATPase